MTSDWSSKYFDTLEWRGDFNAGVEQELDVFYYSMWL
jgi:hypothetical protein